MLRNLAPRITVLAFAAAASAGAANVRPPVALSAKIAGREVRFVAAYYRPPSKTQEFASLLVASEELTCEEINRASMGRKNVDVLAVELMVRRDEGERDVPPTRSGVFPVHDPKNEEPPEGRRSTVGYLRSGDQCEWTQSPLFATKGTVTVKSLRPLKMVFDVTLRTGDRVKGTAAAVTCHAPKAKPLPATSCR